MKTDPILDFKSLLQTETRLPQVVVPIFSIATLIEIYLKSTFDLSKHIPAQKNFELFPDDPGDHVTANVFNDRAPPNDLLMDKQLLKIAV